MDSILRVEHLSVGFKTLGGQVEAVRDVSFDIPRNRVVAIVGESGCGKSVTAKTIMGLIQKPGKISKDSHVYFDNEDILAFSNKQWEQYRGQKCSIVFQDALAALNPTMNIGNQIVEKIRQHRKVSKKEAWAEGIRMLELVGIPNAEVRMKQYPHEFSGGMRQRAMIAMAMACEPKLLIADEPTTALDVTIQAQIFALMDKLKKEHNTSVIMITHDMGVVAEMADDVIVMYMGYIVERGTAEEVFSNPRHPYTAALLSSIPITGKGKNQDIKPIRGSTADPYNRPKGCQFAPRCDYCSERCMTEIPEESCISGTHSVSCFRCQKEENANG